MKPNFCNFEFNKMYALFSVNSFSPEIMAVHNFGHLEGLEQLCRPCFPFTTLWTIHVRL